MGQQEGLEATRQAARALLTLLLFPLVHGAAPAPSPLDTSPSSVDTSACKECSTFNASADVLLCSSSPLLLTGVIDGCNSTFWIVLNGTKWQYGPYFIGSCPKSTTTDASDLAPCKAACPDFPATSDNSAGICTNSCGAGSSVYAYVVYVNASAFGAETPQGGTCPAGPCKGASPGAGLGSLLALAAALTVSFFL